MIIVHSSEIPLELFKSLKDIFLKLSVLSHNSQYQRRLRDPDDVRLKMLMDNSCLLQTGTGCYIGYWEDDLKIPFPGFKNIQYLYGNKNSRSKDDSNVINEFLNNKNVLLKMSRIMDSYITVADFGMESVKLKIYMTICNICDSVLVGSADKIFYFHFTNHHKLNHYGRYPGEYLIDFVTSNGNCVKCGLHYECYDNDPGDFDKLVGYYSGMDSNNDRWCKYDYTAKQIVRTHIFECFEHENIQAINESVEFAIEKQLIRPTHNYKCTCKIDHKNEFEPNPI